MSALQYFIIQNYKKNLSQLAFKKILVEGFDNRFVLNQLHGKQKAKNKFPYLFEKETILYPTKVSLAQSSSEKTAKWKANLVKGDTLLDMTGGFGVDTFHFSKKIKQVTYLEQKEELFALAQHNFKVLKTNNITTVSGNSLDFLKNSKEKFDWIYLDPARRNEAGVRKIGLTGYFPNLLIIKSLLLKKSKNILLKVSPMLDIKQAIQQLQTVHKVIILAVQNEVKELLFLLKKEIEKPISFDCVNLRKEGIEISYQSRKNRRLSKVIYAYPKRYLYEPNASILKAGFFNEIAIDFNIEKLHPNTHLYTSDELISNFPGRIFSCKAVASFNKKEIMPYLDNKKANVSIRNFLYSVVQIKKKLGIKDGGDIYLFGVTLMNEKLKILVCEKI